MTVGQSVGPKKIKERVHAMHKGSFLTNTIMVETMIRAIHNGLVFPKTTFKGFVGQVSLDNFAKICTTK